MSNKECPCNGCVAPKRCPGCHGSCPEYIAWNEEYNMDRLAIWAAKQADNICDDYIVGEIRKCVKKRNEIEGLR